MTLKTKRNLYLFALLLITLTLTFALAFLFYYCCQINIVFKIFYYLLVVFALSIILLKNYKTPTKFWLIILVGFVKFLGVAFVFLDALKGLFYKRKVKAEINFKAQEVAKKASAIYQEVGLYVDYLSNYGEYSVEKTEVFLKGNEFFEEILKQIEGAKKYIFLGVYILKHGKRLNELTIKLYEALERKVEVFLFADYFGSGDIFKTQEFFALKEKGAKFYLYNKPKGYLSLSDNLRYHQKAVVIDGTVSFISTVNVADNLIDNENDIGIKIKGELSLAVLKSFFEIFKLSGFENYCLKDQKGDKKAIFFSGQGGEDIETIISVAQVRAKKEILIISPYLSFSKKRLELLKRLVKKGVKITLIAPKPLFEKGRNFITDESLAWLIDIGVEVLEYDGKFLHSKLILLDRQTCILGSVNFDERSLSSAVENMFVSCDNEVIAPLFEYFSLCKEKSKLKNKTKKTFSFFGLRKIMARILSPLV